ncbi:MAG TPA: hypothetical protein VND96_03875 [Candidatus Micrarchaeaceae archaeon]|nr:hypothetical protein [Candidatus Micrarchaeaceae archaeon]
MRKYLLWASATLALLIAACGSSSPTSQASPTSSCINASAVHHAYVVVEHLAGTIVQRCVGFSGATIDGETLMKQSGLEYQAQTFSGLGKAVCQLDNEPAQFNTCFPQNQPYWSAFVETGGAWTSLPSTYTKANLHDHDALGWNYVPATVTSPSPPPLATPST